VKVLYFAWMRERVGAGEEEVDPPSSVATAGDLADWLAARSEGHAAAFERAALVRIALDHRHVQRETPLAGAREAAFFPPMTGG
jgi:molybdopterin synthase sulfur carrier subunit